MHMCYVIIVMIEHHLKEKQQRLLPCCRCIKATVLDIMAHSSHQAAVQFDRCQKGAMQRVDRISLPRQAARMHMQAGPLLTLLASTATGLDQHSQCMAVALAAQLSGSTRTELVNLVHQTVIKAWH